MSRELQIRDEGDVGTDLIGGVIVKSNSLLRGHSGQLPAHISELKVTFTA